ncbi:MAG: hypothetical protein JNM84_06765, partial [Planctomycetes bacterium]|nr:hypothetical protein [Planctomycetota bacterium]
MAVRPLRRTPLYLRLTLAACTMIAVAGGLELALRASGRAHTPPEVEFEGAVGGFGFGGGIFV